MKRALSYVLIFIFIILIYQFVIIYFSNSHELDYEIFINDTKYTINEKYLKDSDKDGYYLTIKVDNKEFSYYTKNYYNKQKKIINNIEKYEEDDYLCIYPIDIKKKNDFEVLCSDGKETYSSYYLKDEIKIDEFYKTIGTSSKYIQNTETKQEYGDIEFYKKNFYSNEYLKVYRYKTLYVFNKDNFYDISFSNKDIYKNDLGVYINEYFLVPIIKSNVIENYYVINCKTNETDVVYFDRELSTNIHIIGILDNKLYIFDLNNKVEYEISTDGTFKEIGNIDKGFKMYKNGKWEDTSITEFVNDRVTIKEEILDELIYSYDKIYEVNTAYYFVKDNVLYKVYKENPENRITLLKLNKYNNLQIDNERVYYLSGSYLYRYDQYGLKTLAMSNEFNYNNTNIYHIYND